MIPRRYIQEWKEFAPWPDDAHVEQDLVIERALVEIFSDEFLSETWLFVEVQHCINYFLNLR